MTQNPENQNEQPKVHEPEIVDNDGYSNRNSKSYYYTTRPSGRKVYYNNLFAYSPVDMGGCLPACVSFALFFICTGQYGLLAGIGFLVFHIIGSILGSVRAARLLMNGIVWNPWPWRIGNWLISFMLTIWLAGGLNQ